MPKAYSYIRFSTKEQLKGDSERRQLQATLDYVKENNLTLDKKLSKKDLGVSAFSGKHRTHGALGDFLKLIESGVVENGSTLIVENIDRLSREKVLSALNLFTSILDAGIKIVTLHDKMVYSKESVNNNWTELVISISIMARAHEESKAKSSRLKDAWNNKRDKLENGGAKLTSKTPLWIKLSKDKTEFELIHDISEVIELIYRMKLSGLGKTAIVRKLNQNKDIYIPPPSKRNKTGGWRESYIQKILTSKGVIGAFQPHSYIDEIDKKTSEIVKKRKPIGEEIEDYYPAAISKELYYNVQNLINRNRKLNGHAGGRSGKTSNLFTHIAKCGLCGAPMHYQNKGFNQYLACDSKRRNLGCSAIYIVYKEFEELFFNYFEELNISEFTPNKNESELQLNKINKRIISNSQELNDVKAGIKNITDIMTKASDERMRAPLEERLTKLLDRKEKIINESSDLKTQYNDLKINVEQLKKNVDSVNEIYSILNSAKNEDEQIELRLKLKREINDLVEKVEIYPLQEKYVAAQEIDNNTVLFMNSKFIEKVIIRFRGSEKFRYIFVKTTGEKQ